MTHTSKTLLFFGNERLVSGLKKTSAPILSGLVDHGYRVLAVIAHDTATKSRNYRPLEVAEIAHNNSIPVLLPAMPLESIDEIAAFGADAAILVAYGKIIPQEIIDLFPLGIINIHPSLLPKYRGPTPIESTIAHGDSETGVSIMQLTAGMDSGPVFAQKKLPLSGQETKQELYEQLSLLSSELLFEVLPSILDSSLQPTPQDETGVTYSKLFQKDDAWLHTKLLTATEAERQVRAHLGFPKTKVTFMGHDIIITKSSVTTTRNDPNIECKGQTFLFIDELIAPNGKVMSGKDFIRGYTTKN